MPTEIVIGDAHLGHPKVADERGFARVQDHDDTVLHNVYRRADEHSRNHWLGDVLMGGWRERLGLISEIPGVNLLWLGNHDRAFPGRPQAHMFVREYLTVFYAVAMHGQISWNGIKLLIAHLPYEGDHSGQDRYQQWRLRDKGVPLIHSHEHGKHRISFTSRGTMQIHAGLDAWNLRPPTLFELMVEAGFAQPRIEAK